MPASLVPHTAIPDLAARVTADMLKILRRIQKADFIMNGKDVDRETSHILRQLAELGLVDPGYEVDTSGSPYMWVSNGNGSRVLGYLTGIRGGPYYELPALELAEWLEDQGKNRWWNVDGDPLLNGRMSFPCPAADLAYELRSINRPLLIQAKKDDKGATAQPIGKEKLNELVSHFADNLHVSGEEQMPPWSEDRLFYLCWKGTTPEWLLTEDSEMTEQAEADEAAKAK